MKIKTNITARILQPTFWLDDLADEIAVLAGRKNVSQARCELEDFIGSKMAERATATWPDDDLGRAALILFLLRRTKNLPRFVHRCDLQKLANGSAKFRSVLKHRWRRAG